MPELQKVGDVSNEDPASYHLNDIFIDPVTWGVSRHLPGKEQNTVYWPFCN